MLDFDKVIVVIGAGSIGRRYIRNLINLGFKNVIVFRQVGINKIDINDPSIVVINDWEQLLKLKPYAAFICNPTSMHLQVAVKLANAGVHLMIEKPLSNNLENINIFKETLISKNIYMQVGYMMRYHPVFMDLKKISSINSFGRILSVQSKWGEYLPDWHPWEDYRCSYASKKELGGGVALTLSHELDLVNWVVNSRVSKWHILKNYSSSLEVDVESGAEIILKYQNGITANIHLNYYEKIKERFMKIVYENASINIDFVENSMFYKNINKKYYYHDFDRNNLFVDQIKSFFDKTRNFEKKDVLNNINESIKIIKICNG